MSGFAPPSRQHIPSRIDSVKVVEIIRVLFIRGCGQSTDDPVRQVAAFYWPDGTLIYEHDPQTNEGERHAARP